MKRQIIQPWRLFTNQFWSMNYPLIATRERSTRWTFLPLLTILRDSWSLVYSSISRTREPRRYTWYTYLSILQPSFKSIFLLQGKRFKTTFNSAKNIIKKGLKTPGVQNTKKTKPLNLSYWLRRSEVAKNHYNYQGSLTTPSKLFLMHLSFFLTFFWQVCFVACNEVVNWVVAKKSVDVWTKDLAKLRELINEKGMPITENWRPVQGLNGREINSMGSA